jgi:hypothetical protein
MNAVPTGSRRFFHESGLQPRRLGQALLCQILRLKGSSKSANKPPAFDLVTAQRVVEEQNGEIPLPQPLLCRIRYFTDGVILGSKGFVESHFARLKQKLGYKRHRAATCLTALGSSALWAFRDLRAREFD